MDSYPPQSLYYISDALLCITYLIGIVAGVIALSRKKTLPGILAIVAFLFLGLEIVIHSVIYQLYDVVHNYGALSWASYCITTPLLLLGTIALVVVIFMAAGKKETLPPPPDLDEPKSEE